MSKLAAEDVAQAIERASSNLLALRPGAPATDSGRSLDFDRIAFRGALGEGQIAVEISYREDVTDPPMLARIGQPYYEPFSAPALTLNETVAEKLRTLAQRQRPTDLADLAMILKAELATLSLPDVNRLVDEKFKLVKQGDRYQRIRDNIDAMVGTYPEVIRALAPDAPEYREACDLVNTQLTGLLAS